MGIVTDHATTIDGVGYKTRTFPATDGLELGRRLARLVDQNSIGEALLGVEADDLGAVMGDADFMLSLIIGAARTSDAGEWSALCKDLLRQTSADKVRIGAAEVPGSVHEHFDTHFAGRYKHLLDVCVWAARVGFGGL